MLLWEQGFLLDTPTTKRWTRQNRIDGNYTEMCRIFTNFSSIDMGKSRKFIKKCESPIHTKMEIMRHNRLVDFINQLSKFYKEK